MKVFIVSDADYCTKEYKKLLEQVMVFFQEKNFEIIQKSIQKDELHFCIGCYGCWAKTPGECAIKDAMASMNQNFNESDVVLYLSPIVFGQYSSNIKHAIDRWLPNVLPLFVKKADGTTGHPSRYKMVPQMIVIGYGKTITKEEAQLFVDIAKHRPKVEAFVYTKENDDIKEFLKNVNMERMVS